MTITAARPRYLTVTETAKLIRMALKKQYPSTKFSVLSSKYSGGASIHVSWTDGPRAKEVDHILGGFEGASFDGMNDLKSNCDCWLLPDGSAQLAYRPESYGGSTPGFVSDAPHPDAELVSFSSDFVFSNRHVSDFGKRDAEALSYIREHCRCEGEAPSDRFGNEWVENLSRRMAQDFAEGETIEQTFDRVILNR